MQEDEAKLINLSRSISNDAVSSSSTSSGGAGHKRTPSSSSSKPTPKPPSSFKLPSATTQKAHLKQMQDAAKDIKRDVHDKEQAELRRKVTDYLENPKFNGIFNGRVILPGKTADDLHWKTAYEQIISTMKSKYKEAMVRTMFTRGCDVTETILVRFMKMSEYQGLGREITSNAAFFEPELTEIAIEMNNDWVPGPMPRLLLKLAEQISKFSERRTSSSSNDVEPPKYPTRNYKQKEEADASDSSDSDSE